MLARILMGNPDPGLPSYPVMQSAENRGFAPMPRSFADAGARMAAVLRGDVTPTPDEGRQIAAVRGFTEGPASIRAFHGSPHRFDRFDMSRIGTGEGAQAYGHGLYFAGNEGLARGYRERLSTYPGGSWFKNALSYAQDWQKTDKLTDAQMWGLVEKKLSDDLAQFQARNDLAPNVIMDGIVNINKGIEFAAQRRTAPGHMYEVNLNTTPDRLLDWDAPFERQIPQIQNAMSDVFGRDELAGSSNKAIGHRFGALSMNQFGREGGDAAASAALREAGIPGIQYLDAGSRAAGDGTRNYVMFDDKLIDIMRRYGLAGLMALGASQTEFQPQSEQQ
jgi:hypothetical protein